MKICSTKGCDNEATSGWRCRECQASYVKAWRKANPEKQKEIAKRYREKHRDELAKYHRDWYLQNKDEILAAQKEYRENNPEKMQRSYRRWREANEGRVYTDTSGYQKYVGYKHPAASPSGITGYHRIVLWDKLDGKDAPCHWCGMPLYWSKTKGDKDALFTDHINNVKDDNRKENLVPTCHVCNITREGGRRERANKLSNSKCSLDFCDRPAGVRWGGQPVCTSHYQQAYSGKEFTPIKKYIKEERMDDGRVCTVCREFKGWGEFYKRSGGGRDSRCRACVLKRANARIEEKIKEGVPCETDGCENPAITKGLCKNCYHRRWTAEKRAK